MGAHRGWSASEGERSRAFRVQNEAGACKGGEIFRKLVDRKVRSFVAKAKRQGEKELYPPDTFPEIGGNKLT